MMDSLEVKYRSTAEEEIILFFVPDTEIRDAVDRYV